MAGNADSNIEDDLLNPQIYLLGWNRKVVCWVLGKAFSYLELCLCAKTLRCLFRFHSLRSPPLTCLQSRALVPWLPATRVFTLARSRGTPVLCWPPRRMGSLLGVPGPRDGALWRWPVSADRLLLDEPDEGREVGRWHRASCVRMVSPKSSGFLASEHGFGLAHLRVRGRPIPFDSR